MFGHQKNRRVTKIVFKNDLTNEMKRQVNLNCLVAHRKNEHEDFLIKWQKKIIDGTSDRKNVELI